MKNTFLSGVAAAALLAGMNLAFAQGNMERSPAAAGGQQQGAEKIIKKPGKMQQRNVEQGGAKLEQRGKIEQKGKADAQLRSEKPALKARAQEKTKVETTGQAAPKEEMLKPRAQKGGTSVQGESKTMGQGSADSTQGSGEAKVSLSVEQKNKIRTTVLKRSNAPRLSKVNFSLSVGTTIPRTVRYVPLPLILVEIYPSWRGYDYFLVGDQIVVIDPRTLRIVAILDV